MLQIFLKWNEGYILPLVSQAVELSALNILILLISIFNPQKSNLLMVSFLNLDLPSFSICFQPFSKIGGEKRETPVSLVLSSPHEWMHGKHTPLVFLRLRFSLCLQRLIWAGGGRPRGSWNEFPVE